MGIPKHIHVVWIQGQPLPEKYESNVQSMKAHNPLWTITVWDDAMIKEVLKDKFLEMYNKETIFAAKADIARYFILAKHGGVYIDIDTYCLRPLDSLTNTDLWYVPCESNIVHFKNTFISSIPSKNRSFEIYNGMFGCKPSHALFGILENMMFERQHHKTLVYRVGPMLFTDAVFEYHRLTPDDHNYIVVSRWMANPIELGVSRANMDFYKHIAFLDHQSDGSWSLFNKAARWLITFFF
jgi:mannosyltransferase OCH1-like enzyme